MHRNLFRLTLTPRDVKWMRVAAPFVWVFMAVAMIASLQAGRIAEAVADLGVMILVFCAMIGPHFWKIINPASDIVLGKLLMAAFLLGMLTLGAGLAARIVL